MGKELFRQIKVKHKIKRACHVGNATKKKVTHSNYYYAHDKIYIVSK